MATHIISRMCMCFTLYCCCHVLIWFKCSMKTTPPYAQYRQFTWHVPMMLFAHLCFIVTFYWCSFHSIVLYAYQPFATTFFIYSAIFYIELWITLWEVCVCVCVSVGWFGGDDMWFIGLFLLFWEADLCVHDTPLNAHAHMHGYAGMHMLEIHKHVCTHVVFASMFKYIHVMFIRILKVISIKYSCSWTIAQCQK